MKRVNSMPRPNSRILLYFALCVILTFLMLGCGSSSSGSGSDAAASNDTGSVTASLEFQDDQQESSTRQIAQAKEKFDCDANSHLVERIVIEVLDGSKVLARAEELCSAHEAICTGIEPGSNRTVCVSAKNSLGYINFEECVYPVTIEAGETEDLGLIKLKRKNNRQPQADAGPDQSDVQVGEEVILNGSKSTDPNGDDLTYSWSFTSTDLGYPTPVISDPNAVITSFVPEYSGVFQVQLVVSDGTLASDPDLVTITTEGENNPPQFDPIDPYLLQGDEGQLIEFQVTATDPDEGQSIIKLGAEGLPSGATFTNFGGGKGTFSWMTDIGDGGRYPVTFEATDNGTPNLTGELDVEIVVGDTNQRPVAVITVHDEKVNVGDYVYLDGWKSSDPDPGDSIKDYHWSLVSKPEGSTTNPPAEEIGPGSASFYVDKPGSYIVQLVVIDTNGLESDPETATINTDNRPPVANAGPDQQNVPPGSTVELDGSLSTDPDGDTITFRWILTAPDSSDATGALDNRAAAKPTFRADQNGEYVAQLIVNDGELDSSADYAVIDVSVNQPPVIKSIESRPGPDSGIIEIVVRVEDPEGDIVLIEEVDGLPGIEFLCSDDYWGGFGEPPKVTDVGIFRLRTCCLDAGEIYTVRFKASDYNNASSDIEGIKIAIDPFSGDCRQKDRPQIDIVDRDDSAYWIEFDVWFCGDVWVNPWDHEKDFENAGLDIWDELPISEYSTDCDSKYSIDWNPFGVEAGEYNWRISASPDPDDFINSVGYGVTWIVD